MSLCHPEWSLFPKSALFQDIAQSQQNHDEIPSIFRYICTDDTILLHMVDHNHDNLGDSICCYCARLRPVFFIVGLGIMISVWLR